MKLLQEILDWSEVWALFIPLTVLAVRRKPVNAFLKPVVIYLFVALVLDAYADFTWKFQLILHLPEWMWNNNIVYTIHFVTRLLLFSWFFIRLNEPYMTLVKKLIPVLFLVIVIVNFKRSNPFTEFNSVAAAASAAFLIVYCILHYLYLSQQEIAPSSSKRSIGWVVAGLSIYQAESFFIYLFYTTLINNSLNFSIDIWNVQNIFFIIFCIFLAIALNESD
jgi:hypothetical protein